MFEVPVQYAYLTLVFPFLLFWIFLFVWSKRTRNDQLTLSFLGLLAGPLSEILYFQDYWQPISVFHGMLFGVPILLEDLLFGFAIGGIGAVTFDVFSKKRYQVVEKITSQIKFLKFLHISLIISLVSITLFLFGLNSIFATSVGFLFGTGYVLFHRQDLLYSAIGSAFSLTVVMFSLYFVLANIVVLNTDYLLEQIWLLYETNTNLRIAYVPLTELIWAFSVGSFLGIYYKYQNSVQRIKV